jgi:hypothetical protein
MPLIPVATRALGRGNREILTSLREWFGFGGVILAATATAFADVHAAAISLAQVLAGTDSDGFAPRWRLRSRRIPS